MADVIYTNAYLQPGIKSTLFWTFLVLSDSYKWMFLSFQRNGFSELCDRRNAIGVFHESKNKCFQMTMSCLQKRKKRKRLQKSICSSMNPREWKKGKEFEAGCTHAYILLPWGTLQCRAAINTGRMSPQNHPLVHYAFASEWYTLFKVNIYNPHCQMRRCRVFVKGGVV